MKLQSLEQVHLSNPSSNLLDNANVLNISASSSSDRDFGVSVNSGPVAPSLLSHIRPLWDDEPSEVCLYVKFWMNKSFLIIKILGMINSN